MYIYMYSQYFYYEMQRTLAIVLSPNEDIVNTNKVKHWITVLFPNKVLKLLFYSMSSTYEDTS